MFVSDGGAQPEVDILIWTQAFLESGKDQMSSNHMQPDSAFAETVIELVLYNNLWEPIDYDIKILNFKITLETKIEFYIDCDTDSLNYFGCGFE